MADANTISDRARQLVEELRRQGIADGRVLDAIARVPRDRFVPESLREHAWANVALPIGSGQTISQPFVVALMTQALHLTGREKVLEIGTGSGYQAAVLASLAREVVTIERHAELAQGAREILTELGIRNVRVFTGDGTLGLPLEAPFDAIIVTAGAPRPPERLLSQLRDDGGRLVIPIGDMGDQELVAIQRDGDTQRREDLGPVRFVPLIGEGGWPSDTEFEVRE